MHDLKDVLAFHEKFNLPRGTPPYPMTPDMVAFRIPFLYEEHAEFEEAWNGKNLVQAVDALLDLNYVALGTALFIGLPVAGRLAAWPYYHDVKIDMFGSGVILPQHPKFMTIGLHMFYSAQLRASIDAFKLAHDAAVQGELNALECSLATLKRVVIYIYQAAAMMGVPWQGCWEHVQSANMAKQRAKTDGSDSKRSTPWDVVKPEGWKAPDAAIAHSLLKAGWAVNGLDINYRTGKVRIIEERT